MQVLDADLDYLYKRQAQTEAIIGLMFVLHVIYWVRSIIRDRHAE